MFYKALISISLASVSFGCVSYATSGPNTDYHGILYFGESSYFQNADGKFFSLIIDDKITNSKVGEIVRKRNIPEQVCIEMKFAGFATDETDSVGRKKLYVETGIAVNPISCSITKSELR